MAKEIDNKTYYKNLILEDVKVTTLDDKRQFESIITTNAIDRDDEVMKPEGMNIKDFMKNPIILFNHDYDRPIGTGLTFKKSSYGWKVLSRIASEGVSEKADEIWRLVKDGVLKGISIGYQVIERRAATEKDIAEFGKRVRTVISKFKLLEFSIVSVGCNQDALITSCKKLNIDPKNILGEDYIEKEDKEVEIIEDKEVEIKEVIEEVEEKQEIIDVVIEKKIDMDLVLKYFMEEVKDHIGSEIKRQKGSLF